MTTDSTVAVASIPIIGTTIIAGTGAAMVVASMGIAVSTNVIAGGITTTLSKVAVLKTVDEARKVITY